MTVQSLPFIPPAPTVHPKNLPVWRLLWNLTRSSISVWPDYAFDALYIRNSVMGFKTIVVSDPAGVRHVMTANAANYRRPSAVTRFARPLGGSGLFLAEGADWRRQRRLLAPTFTPGSIGLLLPHFRDAGIWPFARGPGCRAHREHRSSWKRRLRIQADLRASE